LYEKPEFLNLTVDSIKLLNSLHLINAFEEASCSFEYLTDCLSEAYEIHGLLRKELWRRLDKK
jgi:hypothetical protein